MASQAGRVRSSSSRSSCSVIHCTGFSMAVTALLQEWMAIARDTALAGRFTVSRRLRPPQVGDRNTL